MTDPRDHRGPARSVPIAGRVLMASGLALAAALTAEVELVNGLVLRGAVSDRITGSSYDYQGKGGGSWVVNLTLADGTALSFYNQQVRQVRTAPEAPPIVTTPEDAPAEIFPGAEAVPYRAGTPILPFGWRGDGSGVYADADPPQEFRPLWRVKVRSWSHSSPIIAGDRILLIDHPHRLVCFDRRTGTMLWQRHNPSHLLTDDLGMPRNDFMWETFRLTSATPVTDGTRVFVHFGHGLVVCYTVEGEFRWARQFRFSIHMRGGLSSSPALLGDTLVIGAYRDETFVGLDAATGATRWTYGSNREWQGVKGTPGTWAGKDDGLGGGWGAFRMITVDGRLAAMNAEGGLVDAVGTILAKGARKGGGAPPSQTADWIDGIAILPLVGTGLSACRPQPDQSWKILWSRPIQSDRSPLSHAGLLYVPEKDGLTVIDPLSGRIVASAAKVTASYCSPVIAGDRLVQVDDRPDSCRLQVLKLGKDLGHERNLATSFQFKGTNQYGMASLPVFAGNRWYFRDRDHLWCLAGGPMDKP